MTDTFQVKPQVTILKVSGSREYVKIAIHDDTTTQNIIEVELTFEDFARAVLGQGRIDGTCGYWCGERASSIGKNSITKTVTVDVPNEIAYCSNSKTVRTFLENTKEYRNAIANGWLFWTDNHSSRRENLRQINLQFRKYE